MQAREASSTCASPLSALTAGLWAVGLDALSGAQSRERLRVFVRRRSLGQMNGEGNPMSESNGRAKRSGGTAFLPIGIVFLAVAIAMIFLGTTACIAFFIMGITFLILGVQKPAGKGERPPSETSQG
jgi:hypothetical protein